MGTSIIPGIDIASTALGAERLRMEVVSSNLANAQVTKDATGQVYKRKQVVFESLLPPRDVTQGSGPQPAGVKAVKIVDDKRPLHEVYMPGHPDANSKGIVTMPNVNPIEEMVDMMTASRSFEANVQVITAGRQMFSNALRIGGA